MFGWLRKPEKPESVEGALRQLGHTSRTGHREYLVGELRRLLPRPEISERDRDFFDSLWHELADEHLKPFLEHADEDVRLGACYAIGELGQTHEDAYLLAIWRLMNDDSLSSSEKEDIVEEAKRRAKKVGYGGLVSFFARLAKDADVAIVRDIRDMKYIDGISAFAKKTKGADSKAAEAIAQALRRLVERGEPLRKEAAARLEQEDG
jgi:hypothetical protein